MTAGFSISAIRIFGEMLLLVCTAAAQQGNVAPSQAPQTTAPQSPVVAPSRPGIPDGSVQGTVLDSVVAVVNSDVILESDVEEERRFESIQPYRGSIAEYSRDRAVQRLIDRTLIMQQAALEPEVMAINTDDLNKQLQTLRRDIPDCGQYHCETDEGWTKFLASRGFTPAEFADRWKKRMELLKLIEVRFRNGIRIGQDEIQQYYEKTMLPEYARQKVAPPPLDSISSRIEEVLLQQQVGNLLRDWLKSLRAQGNVWVMKPGEVAP